MLKLAAVYADLLRSAGIDPEEVYQIELDYQRPTALMVKTKPRVHYVEITITKRDVSKP